MTDPLAPDPNFEVDNEEIQQLLGQLGQVIGGTLPKEWGFMLTIFSFGAGGSTFYVSNAQRPDMIDHLKELIEKLERDK